MGRAVDPLGTRACAAENRPQDRKVDMKTIIIAAVAKNGVIGRTTKRGSTCEQCGGSGAVKVAVQYPMNVHYESTVCRGCEGRGFGLALCRGARTSS